MHSGTPPHRTPHPNRVNLIGIPIDAVERPEAASMIMSAARDGGSFAATALAVHGVLEATRDEGLRKALWNLDLVLPDGQPVRWAVNGIAASGLRDRVAGPELMLTVLEMASTQRLPVALYGSTQRTLRLLCANLARQLPSLDITAAVPSRFRHYISDAEIESDIELLVNSGARIVFVGLGCPRQELWAYEIARRSPLVAVAVGAAFDFHAGLLERPPNWIQRLGLEWMYRLMQEPGRLWRRYLSTNPRFIWRTALQRAGVAPPPIPREAPVLGLPPC